EFRAVERIDPWCFRHELDGFGFTGLKAEADVLTTNDETMCSVLRVLDVGQVHRDGLALFDLNDVWREVAAHDRHPHFHLIAVDFDSVYALGEALRMPIVFDWSSTDLAVFLWGVVDGVQAIERNQLCVMRFSAGQRHIVQRAVRLA